MGKVLPFEKPKKKLPEIDHEVLHEVLEENRLLIENAVLKQELELLQQKLKENGVKDD